MKDKSFDVSYYYNSDLSFTNFELSNSNSTNYFYNIN